MELLKDLYTVKDVAALLDLTESSVRKYIKSNRLKALKLNGAYIVNKADLEEFIRARGE